MTTALKDGTVSRETEHEYVGRKLIVTLTPGGITLHPKGTRRKMKISYFDLFNRLCEEERRGGQSDITIPARKISYFDLFNRLYEEERRGGQSDITIPARKGRRS